MTKFLARRGARAGDLVDYVSNGRFEGLDPHPLLDTAFYARQRGDLPAALASGVSAMTHYQRFGAAEGLNPHPLFDTGFYVAQCPEALEPGRDPVSHYLEQGWRDGLDPHPLFSTTFYLQNSPDVAAAGIQPLLHFLDAGQFESRETSPFFDRRAYVRRNLDVAASGLSPLMHYVLVGSGEGREASRLASFRIATRPEHAGPGGAIAFAREERDSYLAWVRTSRAVPEPFRTGWVERLAGFRFCPPVSVLCHVTEATAEGVRETLRSIGGQLYGNWQLCAVVDPDVPAAVLTLLDTVALADRRVQVLRRGTALEPAFALNAALDAASGEFACILPAGDTLHVLGLASLVEALQGGRGSNVVYGDEDVVDGRGLHQRPVLKPDWSPELLLGLDYLCRATMVRTVLLREAGGYRPGFGGAADHDMMLRLWPELVKRPPRHVTRPLHHRRLPAGTMAGTGAAARQDGLYRAVKEHARRAGFESTVTRGIGPGHLRVAFEPKGEGLVSVVIPTANASFAGPLGQEWVLDNCVDSLLTKTAWQKLEIVVVHDGNLLPDQVTRLSKAGVVLVEYDRPVFNFSRKVNVGVRASRGAHVVILNDDVQAKRPTWLHRMMGWLEQEGVGIVGPRLFFPDGRLQHTGVIVQHGNPGHLYYRADGEDPGYLEMNVTPRNWLTVTGACQLLSRADFEAVGGYDEDLPLNFNDVDFCLRIIELGKRVVYEPHAELYHFEGISKMVAIGNQMTTPYETDHFQARWRGRYPVDPFYHPDLPPHEPLGLTRPEEIRGTASQARKLPAARLARSWMQGVNWLGPMNRSSGMGTAARSYLTSLQAVGMKTRMVPLDKLFGHQAEVEHGLVSTQQDFPVTFVEANADTTNPVFDLYGDEIGRARYRIGLWVWELPAVPPEWFAAAQRYDEIWVPSTFNQSAFQAIMRKPITVLPHAMANMPVLGRAEQVATRRDLGIAEDAFVFLYMFDTYSFVDRKNPAVLLDAFEAEFGDNPDVVLLLKISYLANLHSAYSADNLSVQLKLEQIQARCPNVRVISEVLPQDGVYRVINAADCYVSPHRSEGFGQTVAEAMYFGKVVIATDFSGTTDFVKEGLALPLRYKLIELAEDRGPYQRGNVWADPSLEHLRALMREVAGDRALCARLGAAAAQHMAMNYTPEIIGQIARRRLRAIASEQN